tara:strand:+ start:1655 stop:1831 length:177 start_codon:yes stop_codon:yes gene_type:complete
MSAQTSQTVEIYNRGQRPNFDESIVYYLDRELQKLEVAVRNLQEALKTAEDRLTAGGL